MHRALSAAGYTITASGAVDGDYNINSTSYVPGTLTVTPAILTLTADNKSRAYGAGDPSLTDSISGFVNGDYYDPSKVNGAGTPVFTSSDTMLSSPPVGTYSIAVASLGSLGWNYPTANPNYVFDLAHCVPGILTITPALLTVTANPAASHTYGQATNFAVTDYAISGLINPDTISVTLTSTAHAAGALVAGSPYAIVPSVLVSDPSNYTIVYVNGQLTVNKAPLTITANPQSKTYGAADPALTYQSSGFQLHDTQASAVTGALSRAGGRARGRRPVCDQRGNAGRRELHDRLHGQHADHHPGSLDDHGEWPDQGLRRGDANPDRQLHRLGQRRYGGQPEHPPDAQEHGQCTERCRAPLGIRSRPVARSTGITTSTAPATCRGP